MYSITQSSDSKREDNPKPVSLEISDDNIKSNNNNTQADIISIPNTFDYLITIKKSRFLKIKYFTFGKTIHFYLLCPPKKSQYKLSQIPTPGFTLGPECKFIFYTNI